MRSDWDDTLLGKKFEATLFDVKVTTPGQVPAEGFGRLVWEDDRINVIAYTENDNSVAAFMSMFNMFAPGEIIKPDQLTSLQANTENGWQVGIDGIISGPSMNFTNNISTWKFTTSALRMSRSDSITVGTFSAVLGASYSIFFPRISEVTDGNPTYGQTKKVRDWLQFDTDFGVVVIRQLESKELLMRIEGDLQHEELIKAFNSVQLAVSFVEGRNIKVIGYEIRANQQRHRWITRDTRTTRSRFSPPFGYTGQLDIDYEAVLAKAANFFHTPTGKIFSDRLSMCWLSVDSYGTQRVLTICPAIEKLVKRLSDRVTISKDDAQEATKAAIKSLVSSTKEAVGNRFVDRIKSFLDSMDSVDFKTILNHCVTTGFLGITQADFTAWKELRNSGSHGEIMFPDDDGEFEKRSKNFQSLLRLENLLNKLVLNEMGYEGLYHDRMSSTFIRFPG